MKFHIISAIPELMDSPLSHSILQRARDKGLIEIELIHLRNFGIGKNRQIDDYQYGGGAGMVIMPEVLSQCIDDCIKKHGQYDEIVYLTPDGNVFDQKNANSLSLKNQILIICGHYKGIDQRIRDKYVTLELSIGDYVLSGGELAACILVDSIGRLIPGVLNDETSALTDSFQDGYLAPPVYTRPAEFDGMKVPNVLLSGEHKKIEEWRMDKSLEITKKRRPDLLKED